LAQRLLKSVGESGLPHVHAVAAERDALGGEMGTLARTLRQRAVGANHAPPRQVGIVALEEDRAGEARCARGDIAVSANEPGWDLADASEDFE
jgi:hypothetical protein